MDDTINVANSPHCQPMLDRSISIIFGGMSPEHPASVASFSHVLERIRSSSIPLRLKHIYFVDKTNAVTCHAYSSELSAEDFVRTTDGSALPFEDMVPLLSKDRTFFVNLLHGKFGEDGHLQGLARICSINGTFGDVLPSALAMSKYHMQKYAEACDCGLSVPKTMAIKEVELSARLRELHDRLP